MRFSTSFLQLLILSVVTLGTASCAYVIPPETNPPRENDVMGERRKPQLNGAVGPQSNATQRVVPQQPVEGQLTGKETAPQVAAAAPTPASPVSDRHVPVENVPYQQLAANDAYPPITSVPPRPVMTGPDSARERLSETKTTLERDRANAEASKAKLDKDAAEEPSMLSDLPKTDGVVPAADPVRVAPAIAPPPANAAPSVTVPTPEQIRPRAVPSSSLPSREPLVAAAPRVIAPPPATAFEPPVEEPNAIAAAAPVAAAPAKVTAVAVEIAQAPVPAPVQALPSTPVAAKPQVKKGDFDPLAVADNAPITTQAAPTTRAATSYASNGYIAPSRYAERRY